MPRRKNAVSYSLRQTTSSVPNPNKQRRGPYKKRPPRDDGPIPDHEHTYPVGERGERKSCIVCGLKPPTL